MQQEQFPAACVCVCGVSGSSVLECVCVLLALVMERGQEGCQGFRGSSTVSLSGVWTANTHSQSTSCVIHTQHTLKDWPQSDGYTANELHPHLELLQIFETLSSLMVWSRSSSSPPALCGGDVVLTSAWQSVLCGAQMFRVSWVSTRVCVRECMCLSALALGWAWFMVRAELWFP